MVKNKNKKTASIHTAGTMYESCFGVDYLRERKEILAKVAAVE